jgi:hypothetical protein
VTSFPVLADTLHLHSGIKRNSVVELYTSEGCSSCPPAEDFLNNYKKNKDLWKRIIPVAFHVNYWDYLGWRDRYANKLYGQRQSKYAGLHRVSTVYTPAFIVNGKGWRPGLFSNNISMDSHNAGILVVDIEGEQIHANFTSTTVSKVPLMLNVVVLGMNLSDNIERGENQGRKAQHEFVAVGYHSARSENANWNMRLPRRHYRMAKEHAVALWVSTIDNPTPLQAVGGKLELN